MLVELNEVEYKLFQKFMNVDAESRKWHDEHADEILQHLALAGLGTNDDYNGRMSNTALIHDSGFDSDELERILSDFQAKGCVDNEGIKWYITNKGANYLAGKGILPTGENTHANISNGTCKYDTSGETYSDDVDESVEPSFDTLINESMSML